MKKKREVEFREVESTIGSIEYSIIFMIIRVLAGVSLLYTLGTFFGGYFIKDNVLNINYLVGIIMGFVIIYWTIYPIFIYFVYHLFRIAEEIMICIEKKRGVKFGEDGGGLMLLVILLIIFIISMIILY